MGEPQRTPGRYGTDEIEANLLEPWPNPHPMRDYVVHLEAPEFTCLCPRSGFPDFSVRGNIKTIIFAEHTTPQYQGPRPAYRRYGLPTEF